MLLLRRLDHSWSLNWEGTGQITTMISLRTMTKMDRRAYTSPWTAGVPSRRSQLPTLSEVPLKRLVSICFNQREIDINLNTSLISMSLKIRLVTSRTIQMVAKSSSASDASWSKSLRFGKAFSIWSKINYFSTSTLSKSATIFQAALKISSHSISWNEYGTLVASGTWRSGDWISVGVP